MPATVDGMLRAALDCHGRGWVVFPLIGKLPRVKWRGAAPDRAQLEAWWTEWPDAGIGLALGPVSNVVRVDADGPDAVAKVAEYFGDFPPTCTFTTPGGGVGWLFEHSTNVSTEVFWRGPSKHEELRLMSEGSYTVIPPSRNPDGGEYVWTEPPWRTLPAKLPERVTALLRSKRAERLLRELEHELRGTVEQPPRDLVLEALDHCPGYDDYDTWLQVGMALKSLGEENLASWDEWSKKSFDKWEEGACARKWATLSADGGVTGRSILHWAKASGWHPPRREPFTDTGNAARLVAEHRADMRFCHQWGKWLVWDGTRWANDVDGSAIRNAKRVFEKLFDEAMNEFQGASAAARKSEANGAMLKKKMSGKLLQHAIRSQDRKCIDAALYLAQCELPALPEQLDRDPYLLNCPNGTVELRSGTLRAHDRLDMCTKLCPTPFDADAPCSRWEQFMLEVFEGKETLVQWTQRLFGYCLTGDTAEHILPILHGCGANGKSTMLNTLMEVMGPDYACKAPRDLLVHSRSPQHPTNLATLFGKRLVAAVETGDSARLDETIVKELTGADVVSCRRMYEDFWTFKPTHKILLATNHQPEVRGTDYAVWRRLRLVPFSVTFKETADKSLPQKLLSEASGILAWMARGCLEWQRLGLGEAAAVSEATTQYRGEQDRLAEFLQASFERRGDCRSRVADVIAKYSAWCRTNREPELSGKAFGQAMRERGIDRDATKKYYIGLKEL